MAANGNRKPKRFTIELDERWPEYSLEAVDGSVSEDDCILTLTAAEVRAYNKACGDFQVWQKRIADFRDAHYREADRKYNERHKRPSIAKSIESARAAKHA